MAGRGAVVAVFYHRAGARRARHGPSGAGAPVRVRALHAEPDHGVPRHDGALAREGGRHHDRRGVQAPYVDGHHPADGSPRAAAWWRAARHNTFEGRLTERIILTTWTFDPLGVAGLRFQLSHFAP